MMSASASQRVLEMAGIEKSFSGIPVLRGVDFEVLAGEVHVLAGGNGAGKSTLVKILSGVHTADGGTIRLDGRSFRPGASRREIAVIYQELSLAPALSVLENIFLGAEQCGPCGWLAQRRQRQLAGECLKKLDLNLDLDAPVETYPLATRQMIEIAKSLAHDSRIVLMDEPTSALGKQETDRLFAIISRLRQEGRAVVYITHKMEEIFAVGDRLSVLRDGKTVFSGRLDGLAPRDIVRNMIGREPSQQFPARDSQPLAEIVFAAKDISVPDPSGRPRPAVQSVSFSVRRGEIVGFAGLEGAGNHELFSGLFGAYGRVSGHCSLRGKPFEVASPAKSLAQGLALATHDRKADGLLSTLDITDNITAANLRAYTRLGFLNRRAEERSAAAHVESMQLRCAGLSQGVTTLSGGNQQKVILARWLDAKPDVLLLDDPTRGVDAAAKCEIYGILNRLVGRGLCILLISSESSELLALCDRILVMHRGRIAAEFGRGEGTVEKLMAACLGSAEDTRND